MFKKEAIKVIFIALLLCNLKAKVHMVKMVFLCHMLELVHVRNWHGFERLLVI